MEKIQTEAESRLKMIVLPLLDWYRTHKRALPWRERGNAYDIWVSEIMLQQTRVEAVKPYYARFMNSLPDVQALADCPEEQLLKLWEGLGYYNRVRNMQAAARTVVEQYDGVLPASYEKLLGLKGIGSYTAGAIASIAYGLPVPAVDGNVLRVVSRITEDGSDIQKQSVKKCVEQLITDMIPKDVPGEFNQAMMELGATICVPNGPARCGECPAAESCLAYQHGTVSKYPVKTPPKARMIEERTVLVIQDGLRTAIRKRPSKGLLAGLYELPNVSGRLSREEALKLVETLGLEPLYIEELEAAKHIFSHIEWHMTGFRIRVAELETETAGFAEGHAQKNGDMDFLFESRKETQQKYAIPTAFAAYTKYMRDVMEDRR